MKIHSDTLTYREVYAATAAAGMRGVTLARCDRHGSRSRDHSYDVTLRGNSTRKPNPGTGGRDFYDDEYAATWDEWGMFIQALYESDPNALIGQYGERHVFEDATAMRFTTLTAGEACRLHQWVFSGTPHVSTCKRCGATNNYSPIIEAERAKRAALEALRSVN